MPVDFRILEAKALELHGEVSYGKDKTMYDQVKQSADLAAKRGEDSLVALAWLHKSQEQKRINPKSTPLSEEEIKGLLIQAQFPQEEVQKIVESLGFLKSAATAEKIGKEQGNVNWESAWAITVPVLAQSFLVIEKLINFQTSLDVLEAIKVNPGLLATPGMKEPKWHQNYYVTRGAVVQTIAEHSPDLKSFCDEVLAVGAQGQALATSLINPPVLPASTSVDSASLSQNQTSPSL